MYSKRFHLPFATLVLLLGVKEGIAADQPGDADSRPAIIVEASYPGANAQVVADTVAAPIEHQVNGVENMMYLSSQYTNDGNYCLTVTFKPGTDLKKAEALVQNRVSLALPVVPDLVKRRVVSVKKAFRPLMLVNLFSRNGSRDPLYLSNYANIHLKDEFSRISGIGKVTILGQLDYSVRVWLEPDKMSAFALTAAEAAKAIEQQNIKASASPIELRANDKKPILGFTLESQASLPDLEKIENIILKDAKGQTVRLRDVGRVELGAAPAQGRALLDGKPVVVLTIAGFPESQPRELRNALQKKLLELRSHYPNDVDDVAIDFTANLLASDQPDTPEFLLLDLDMPERASPERSFIILSRCAAALQDVKGVQDVLAMSEHPFAFPRKQAGILARLAPAAKRKASREQLVRNVRTWLGQINEVGARLRDPLKSAPCPGSGYPLDLVLHGPEEELVNKLGEKLSQRLQKSEKFIDLWKSAGGARQPFLLVDIDRDKVKALGVSREDLASTFEVFLGPQLVQDPGRTWQFEWNGDPARLQLEDLKELKVRNTKGEMVPVSALASVRLVSWTKMVERLNGQPMIEITANLGAGVSLAEARALCDKLIEEIRKELHVPAEYRLTWMREWSKSKSPAPSLK